MSKVVTIPAEKLGVLEQHFVGLTEPWPSTKRKRQSSFNQLTYVLKALALVERKSDIKALAYGLSADGGLAAFIICEVDQRQGGEVGPGLVSAARRGDSTAVHMDDLAGRN